MSCYTQLNTVRQKNMPELYFWLNHGLVYSVLYIVSYVNGLWVLKGVKVNYTRKINHFTLFLCLPLAKELLPFERSSESLVWGVILTILALAIYVRPIRRRSRLIATMFLSFDRPEDRPYTLIWLTTQFLASYLILIPLGFYLHSIDRSALIYLPVLINGIGDGLAEPVGVRYGRHKYRTWALFSKTRYTRSLEGSACVLVTGFLCVLLFAGHFNTTQLTLALLVLPLAMTLAEAFSPHTWDSPMLYLTGGIVIIGLVQLP